VKSAFMEAKVKIARLKTHLVSDYIAADKLIEDNRFAQNPRFHHDFIMASSLAYKIPKILQNQRNLKYEQSA